MNLGLLSAVGVFLFLLLLTGLRQARSRHDADDYFIAGKSRRFWSIFSSLSATVIGGSATIGLCGLAARVGFEAAVWLWGGVAGLVLAGFFVARPVVRENVYTVPEYLRRMYRPAIARVAALVIVLSWLGVIAAQLLAAGQVIRQIVPLSLPAAVLLMAAVLGLYVWAGGQQSVVKTDLLQFGLLLAGFVWLFGAVVRTAGPDAAANMVRVRWQEFLDMSGGFNGETVALFLVIAVTFVTGPDIFSRFLCARDPGSARRAAWAAAAVLGPFSLLVVALGVVGATLSSGLAGDELLPGLASLVVHSGFLQGLILAGILAAVLSSADTCVMTAATILTMETRHRPAAERGSYIRGMNLAVPAIIGGASMVALLFPSILGALLSGYLVYTAVISPILLPPLLGAGRPVPVRRVVWLLAGGLLISLLAILHATIMPVAVWFLAALLLAGWPWRNRRRSI